MRITSELKINNQTPSLTMMAKLPDIDRMTYHGVNSGSSDRSAAKTLLSMLIQATKSVTKKGVAVVQELTDKIRVKTGNDNEIHFI